VRRPVDLVVKARHFDRWEDKRSDAFIDPWRVARPDGSLTNAPPWVVAVVDGLAAMMANERSRGRLVGLIEWAISWCSAGEPVYRAERLLTFVQCCPRPARMAMLSTFLETVERTREGRHASATNPRHFDATVRIARSWGEP
jgi:hypothetical protein